MAVTFTDYERLMQSLRLVDLVAAGHTCLVVAPSMVPSAQGQRVKTNQLDSSRSKTSKTNAGIMRLPRCALKLLKA